MITVTLYNRKDCHLCDQVKEDLNGLQEEIPHQLVEIDVDRDPDLRRAYGELVPVVEAGPYQLKAPFDYQELRITLGAARSRLEDYQSIDPGYVATRTDIEKKWSGADGFSFWIARHYLALFNLLVFIYVGLPFLAPVLMKAGADGPARLIYQGYSLVCHQLPFRSWFLFGEQAAYPRLAAGVHGLIPYEQAIGISLNDLWQVRRFIGNETVGFKVAICERDIAIYGSILFFGLVFALVRRRLPPLPFVAWLLLGILPIGIDGVTQIISQPPLSLIPFRESTPMLRTLTGFLFGFSTAWFGYPMVEQTMAETRRILAAKRLRLGLSVSRAD